MSDAQEMAQQCDAAFQRKVRLACYGALEDRGFTRFRREGVDRPIHDGFHCWVGLNTALRPDRVEVLPFVGLHVVPIEKLWTSLKTGRYSGKYDRGVATYGVNMGELQAAADERAFAFSPSQSQEFINSECARLAHLYVTAGFEFACSIASYEVLLPRLQERVEMLGGYPERIATCLNLMGRKADARAFVATFPDKYRDYFEGFAVPFLRMLDGERDGLDPP